MCTPVNPCCFFSLFSFLSNQITNLNKRQYCWKNELENELLLRNIPYIFCLLAQLYPKILFSQLYIFYSLLLFAPEPIVCSKQWDLLYTVHLVVKSVHSKIQPAFLFGWFFVHYYYGPSIPFKLNCKMRYCLDIIYPTHLFCLLAQFYPKTLFSQLWFFNIDYSRSYRSFLSTSFINVD